MTRDPRLRTSEEIKAPKKPAADGERFPKRRQPEYVTWFSMQAFPCVVAERLGAKGFCTALGHCWGVLENAHLKSRGAGGVDVGNLVKLCSAHHRRLHTNGQKQFEYYLGSRLRPYARKAESQFYAFKKHGP